MKQIILLCLILLSTSLAQGQENDAQANVPSRSETPQKEHTIKDLLEKINLLEWKVLNLEKKLSDLTTNAILHEKPASNDSTGKSDDVFSLADDKQRLVGDVESESKIIKNNKEADKEAYDIALATLKEGRLEEAEKEFADFIAKHHNSQFQSNAYFWYAETFFRRKMFNEAAINYLKGYKQFPKGAKASDSVLKLALSLGELKKKQEACNMLDKFDTEFNNKSATSIKTAKDARVKMNCKPSSGK